jgi:hypothetical protein
MRGRFGQQNHAPRKSTRFVLLSVDRRSSAMKMVMYFCGILFIVVGIGGAIGYAQFPEPANFIAAPVWALAFIGSSIFFFRAGAKFGSMLKPEDIQNGVVGTATLVTFRPGGMRLTVGGYTSIMVTFTVDVNLPGQQPYRVSGFQAMWPELRLGSLRPGEAITVRVDRTNPQRMAFDFDTPPSMAMQMGGGMGAMGGAMPGPAMPGQNPYAPQGGGYGAPGMNPQMANNMQMAAAFQQLAQQGQLAQATAGAKHGSAAELLAHGTPGRASVMTATPTGQALPDGRFIYAFTMQVWVQGSQAPIEAAVLHAVPPQAMARAVPGASLAVAVDPANPTRSVAIDWNRP